MINRRIFFGLTLLLLHMETLISQIISDSRTPGFYDAVNNFSLDFYREIIKAENGNNMVYSPIGSWAIIYRIYETAGDGTLEPLRSALYLKNEDIPVRSIVRDITKVQWRAAFYYDRNRLELSNLFEPDILLSYLLKSAWKFGEINVNPVDFWQRDEVSRSINNWIKEQSGSQFTDIVQPDDLENNVQYVATVFLYFDGYWTHKFDPNQTTIEKFHLQDGSVKNIETMKNLGLYKHGYLSEISAEFLEIPFEGGNSSSDVRMIVILPNSNVNLTFVEGKLKDIEMTRLLDGKAKLIDLYLPKFKLETTIDFNSTLENLGLGIIHTNAANFGEHGSPSKVGKIIQKTFIEIREEGTKTSSVSEPFVIKRSYRSVGQEVYKFQIDHPFLILICTENIILFRARIFDPQVNRPRERNSRPITIWDLYRFIIWPVANKINHLVDDYKKDGNLTNVLDEILPDNKLPTISE